MILDSGLHFGPPCIYQLHSVFQIPDRNLTQESAEARDRLGDCLAVEYER